MLPQANQQARTITTVYQQASVTAAQIVGPSGSVIGADISPGMLAVAERRLTPLPNVTIKVMDAQALDLPDASVDTITCSLAMMLLRDPAQALREMHRVLRPTGYVSISVLTTPAQSLTANVQDVIGRYRPDRAAAAAK
jgi:ubiquinone/menaquinone biosynthesis C-methylase UbiE